MKIAYFDCFSGASGDMILGALLDAGLELEKLKAEVSKIGLSHYEILVKKVVKRGIGGSQAVVRVDSTENHAHHHRNLDNIRKIIKSSQLNPIVKNKSIKVFERLAEAEAKVHRTAVENIHFHEVGALDAIIDVVGGVAGIEAMGIEAVYCSPLHLGSGSVECAHGTFPVPAPATLELVRGKPVYSTGVSGELLTPTGAAILTTLANDFGPMPEMIVQQVGYGSGEKDRDIANLLRISIGVANMNIAGYQAERVAILETNIDDMNPQIYGYLMEKLPGIEGVMDVFLLPVQMKKNRPATLVKVLCSVETVNIVADFLLRETTSIGLRWHVEQRIKTFRKIEQIETPYGVVRFKIASLESGEVLNIFPEYEDCKKLAMQKGVPLKMVMEKAVAAASKFEILRHDHF
ncbi:MAG: nickel pincer cofactor biosynthesis protein LarC [Desulfobacterales bacterium]